MTKLKLALLAAVATLSLTNLASAQLYQQGPKLVGMGAIGNAFQGYSISLSSDGNTAVVGGPLDNSDIGGAWAYTRSAGLWSQQAKLVGSGATGVGLEQGYSVSISADGTTVIVGAPFDETNGFTGAAWVFTRTGGLWIQQAKLVGTDQIGFGISVALSGDGKTAVVGTPLDAGDLGAAWVFVRTGAAWSQQAKLVGTGGIGLDQEQGASVSLSADGNTAIIGGPQDNGQAGAAWVFTRAGTTWTQQGPKLVGIGAVGFVPANQGSAVALSGDGNTAIVGGPRDNSDFGAAWVYARSDGIWNQQGQKLVGTGAVGHVKQGWSVSLSGDGNVALVGALSYSDGAAWVFTRLDGLWAQNAKLVGTGAIGTVVEQGISVALSGDGNTAIVGGPGDNGGVSGVGRNGVGAAWVFAPFAGTPGTSSCYGQSVSTLVREFGGLNAAAIGTGFPSISALQNAIQTYCEA